MDLPLFPFDLNEVSPLSASEHAAFEGVSFPTSPEAAITELLFNGRRARNNPNLGAGRPSAASLAYLSAPATVHTGHNTSPAEQTEETQQQTRSKRRLSMELSQETTTFYTLPTEDDPYRTIQSKKFIPKIMFVAVVGRPRFGESGETLWDGKVGIFPFTYEEAAKRNSKNRPAGTLETKPVDVVNRQVMKAMMLTRVIPEIKSKWPDAHNKHIIIQQDNAKPHVDPADSEIVQVCQENGWDIKVQLQPPNSPDLNVLDLGFFRAIDSIKDQKALKNVKDLISDVEKAFEEMTPQKLNRVFLTYQCCMEEIIKQKGGNQYKIPHMGKDRLERMNQLPDNIQVRMDDVVAAQNFIASEGGW
ncbi:unnamed protein product [Cuscuta campestris]|uniref:Tc1-like transposase DDE domain-containing protein n=1 Tax=Cuscuta campestris TaxID=132261 RepID=A0A484NF49_9ASTE|nr:unnamed protein product [Cuscuta campestris]